MMQKDAPPDPAAFVASLERGLMVLQAFCPANAHLTLSEVAALTNLTAATARRALHTLVALGYVRRENRLFSLRPRVLALSAGYLGTIRADLVLEPALRHMAHETGCDSAVAMLDDVDAICVAYAPSNPEHSPRSQNLGMRHPAHRTAAGQVLLAGLRESMLQHYLARLKVGTVPPEAEIAQWLRTIEKRGFATVEDELDSGTWSIAVPVVGPKGNVVASLSCSHVAYRPNRAEVTRACLSTMREAAKRIQQSIRLQPNAELIYCA